MQSLLDGVGLDPYLGFYHTVSYGRPSFALDLLEEYRHTLIDRLALKLFNLDILKSEDFQPVPGGGIYLATSGKRKFFTYYEETAGEWSSATDTIEKPKKFRAHFQQRIRELVQAIQLSEFQIDSPALTEEDFDPN